MKIFRPKCNQVYPEFLTPNPTCSRRFGAATPTVLPRLERHLHAQRQHNWVDSFLEMILN